MILAELDQTLVISKRLRILLQIGPGKLVDAVRRIIAIVYSLFVAEHLFAGKDERNTLGSEDAGLFNDDVINLVKRIKKLSKSQRILIDSIIDTELALSAYKDESCHTEDLISVLIPTGNMTDGMILDSYNVEKLDVSNYRKAFGDALHIGIRITSNHLHPVYNKGDILLISRNPIRDGDTGIFINAQNKRAYIRKLHQKNPCELTPINNYGETFYVDSDNVDDMSKWIKFGHVLCKVR